MREVVAGDAGDLLAAKASLNTEPKRDFLCKKFMPSAGAATQLFSSLWLSQTRFPSRLG
jgi:hypothetical protein